jgi:peptidyl-prolyl cis-trans isomerase A (cyclophilin A)
MIRTLALFLLAALASGPLLAQSPTPVASSDVRIALDTSAGRIVVALHPDKAPVTAGNFLRYVDQKRFDGTVFYRAVGGPDYGFIQGGTQNDPKRVLPPIKHEPTSQTGLTHDDGALSMARYAPGSATGDFFIVLGKVPAMDAQPESAGDNQGFAVFAHVVGGWIS